MDISVLMSVYYKEKSIYLSEAIESVLNQTYKPKQFVIVKDGELTDELECILKKYKEKYPYIIEVYQWKGKQGLGEALKFGVGKCKFKYIARMDADDIAVNYRFEKQIERLMQDETIDILGGNIEEYDEKMEQLISVRKVPKTLNDIQKYIKIQCPFNHSTVIIKKDALIKAGNYNSVKMEDYDLWARMLLNGCKMENLDMVLGKNRTGKSMYRRRSGIKQVAKAIEIENKLLSYGIINIRTYISNIVNRAIFAFVPINIKQIIYKNVIRKVE